MARPRALAAAVAVAAVLAPAAPASASASASDAGTWRTAQPAPVAVQEVASAALGDQLYLAGGITLALPPFTTLHHRYDTSTDTWTQVAPLPAAEHHLHGEAIDTTVYYLGGLRDFPFVISGQVYAYDPTANTFTTKRPMPAGRERGAVGAAQLDDKIYVAGGLRDDAATALFDVYDPATDTWTALPDLPHPREHLGAAFVGDRLYVVGGRTSSGGGGADVTETDVYDVSEGRWISGLAPLPTPRGGLAVAAFHGRVFAIGGEGGGGVHAENEAYDPERDAWSPVAPMPTPRHGIQAASHADAIWLAGGATSSPVGPSAAHEAFVPPMPEIVIPAPPPLRPRLLSLTVARAAIRAGRDLRATVTLSGPARIEVRIQRRSAGRAPRYTTLARRIRRTARAGANRLVLRRLALRPGRYRLVARINGERAELRAPFRISRPPRR